MAKILLMRYLGTRIKIYFYIFMDNISDIKLGTINAKIRFEVLASTANLPLALALLDKLDRHFSKI